MEVNNKAEKLHSRNFGGVEYLTAEFWRGCAPYLNVTERDLAWSLRGREGGLYSILLTLTLYNVRLEYLA